MLSEHWEWIQRNKKGNVWVLHKSNQALNVRVLSHLSFSTLSLSLQEALLWPETLFTFSKIRFEYLFSALAVFHHLSHTTVKSPSQTTIQRPTNSRSVLQTHTRTAYWGKTDSQSLNHSHAVSTVHGPNWLRPSCTPTNLDAFNIWNSPWLSSPDGFSVPRRLSLPPFHSHVWPD